MRLWNFQTIKNHVVNIILFGTKQKLTKPYEQCGIFGRRIKMAHSYRNQKDKSKYIAVTIQIKPNQTKKSTKTLLINKFKSNQTKHTISIDSNPRKSQTKSKIKIEIRIYRLTIQINRRRLRIGVGVRIRNRQRSRSSKLIIRLRRLDRFKPVVLIGKRRVSR